eukprot:4772839-Amphidinium_carterae.3
MGLPHPRKHQRKSVGKPSKQSLQEEELYRLIERLEFPSNATKDAPAWWSKGQPAVLTAEHVSNAVAEAFCLGKEASLSGTSAPTQHNYDLSVMTKKWRSLATM